MEGGGFEAVSKNKLVVVCCELVGVVLVIVFFNYLVNLFVFKIVFVLIVGNVVMFKLLI